MTPLDRRIRRRRRGALLVIAVVLVGLVVLGVRLGCGGDESEGSDQDGGPVVAEGEVEAKVGETVKVGTVVVALTAFAPIDKAVRPRYPIDDSVPTPAAAGETFYQAFLHFDNPGEDTFRYDPVDFELLIGDLTVDMDPAYTGPGAQTLLPTASLDAIVSFRAPAGSEVKLRYTPTGTEVTIIFTGTRKPEGMAAAAAEGVS